MNNTDGIVFLHFRAERLPLFVVRVYPPNSIYTGSRLNVCPVLARPRNFCRRPIPSLSFSLFLIHLLTHVCYQISIKIAATALPIFHVEDTRYRPQFRRSRTPLKEREFISIRELRSSRTGYTESLHFSALAFTGPPRFRPLTRPAPPLTRRYQKPHRVRNPR